MLRIIDAGAQEQMTSTADATKQSVARAEHNSDLDAIEARAQAATPDDVHALLTVVRTERAAIAKLSACVDGMLIMASAATEFADGYRTALTQVQEQLKAISA